MYFLKPLHCVYITLTYNATKLFALCFNRKHIKIKLPEFVLGKFVIPAVDKYVNT